MMRTITVTNFLNQSLELDIRRPDKTGLTVINPSGLGPGEANILMTELVTQDGAIYDMARKSYRTIEMTIKNGRTGELTEEDTRHRIYKYFPLKRPLTLRFQTDRRDVSIEGLVERNEAVIFSNQVHSNLSIVCPDPWFYDRRTQITEFLGVEPLFEFPFSNESLTENLLEMGRIFEDEARTIYYEGDVEVGVVIYLYAEGPIVQFRILDELTGGSMSINDARLAAITGSGIIRYDKIVIDTRRGKQSIRLYRDNQSYNIINALNRDATQFRLRKGDNVFRYTAYSGIENAIFRIENQIAFEGL